MQDKSKDILANNGWEAMELILDKEMPQKKKRRFFIWWFFGGILLVAALLMFRFDLIGAKPTAAITQQQKLEVQTEKFSDVIESTSQETEKKIVDPSESLRGENKNSGGQSTNQIADPKQQKINTSRSDRGEVIKPIKETEDVEKVKREKEIFRTNSKAKKLDVLNPVSVKNQEPIAENKADTNTDKSSPSIVKDPIKNTKTGEIIKESEEIDVALSEKSNESENLVDRSFKDAIEQPLKDRLLLDIAMLNPDKELDEIKFERDIIITQVKEKRPSYWYANLGGSLGWGPAENLMDLATHIDLGYSFHDKIDLGLTVGVGAFRYAASTTEKSLISGAGRNVFSLDEAQNILNSSFDNTSYLELGTHFTWHATEKLSIRAGSGYDYLFTSMFNRSGGTSNDVLDTPVGTPFEMMDVEITEEPGETISFEYTLTQKWFPYTSIGLQYGVNDKLALNLAYKKVYGELFEQSSNPLSMDRFRLGVQYRFLDKPSKQ